MNFALSMSTILTMLLCISLVYTSAVNLGCKCTCCIPTTSTACEFIQSDSNIFNTNNCETDKCRNTCQKQYLFCKVRQGIINGICFESSQ